MRATLATLALGAVGGGLFQWLGAPLPWVLGSLTATALLGRALPRLALAAPVRSVGVLVIGTLLGANSAGLGMQDLIGWLPTLLAASALALAYGLLGYCAGRRWLRMDRVTAILSSVPAGLPLVTPMMDGTRARPERVGLVNTIRLITVLATAATVAGLLGSTGGALPGASGNLSDPLGWLGAAAIVLTGFLLAPRLPLPSPLLIAPMILAGLAVGSGVMPVALPPVAVMAAQVVIGSGVGLHFRSYRIKEMPGDVGVAAITGVVCIALAYATVLGFDDLGLAGTLSLFLAFVPAGAPEMALLAMTLGANPGMVVAHHVLRVALLAAAVPLIVARFGGREDAASEGRR